jgi:hypothetical protein
MRRSHVLALAFAASLSFAAPAAVAQGPGPSDQDIALARNLGQQGEAAMNAKDYKKAEDLFARAHNLYPAALTLTLGLARAQAAQHRWVEASESYNSLIRTGLPPNASQPFQDAYAAARNEIGPAQQKISNVVITVKDASGADVPYPTVLLDGQAFKTAALGVQAPVDAGQHTVHASADGYSAGDATFSVEEAGNATANVVLQKVAGAQQTPGTTGATTGATPGTTGATTTTTTTTGGDAGATPAPRSKIPMFVAFGVGGVGLVVGVITGVIAMGNHSTLGNECTLPNGMCPASAQSDLDSYHSMATISTIGFIVGAVGAAAGVVLLVTQPKTPAATQSAWVSPYVGAGSVGALGAF